LVVVLSGRTEATPLPLSVAGGGVKVQAVPQVTVWLDAQVMVGGVVSDTVTVKLAVLVARPPAAMTEIGPVVALAGTVAVIWLAEFRVKAASIPLNRTRVASPPHNEDPD
jgi:hypothetical protein